MIKDASCKTHIPFMEEVSPSQDPALCVFIVLQFTMSITITMIHHKLLQLHQAMLHSANSILWESEMFKHDHRLRVF